jgi:hypothetical protein
VFFISLESLRFIFTNQAQVSGEAAMSLSAPEQAKFLEQGKALGKTFTRMIRLPQQSAFGRTVAKVPSIKIPVFQMPSVFRAGHRLGEQLTSRLVPIKGAATSARSLGQALVERMASALRSDAKSDKNRP